MQKAKKQKQKKNKERGEGSKQTLKWFKMYHWLVVTKVLINIEPIFSASSNMPPVVIVVV